MRKVIVASTAAMVKTDFNDMAYALMTCSR